MAEERSIPTSPIEDIEKVQEYQETETLEINDIENQEGMDDDGRGSIKTAERGLVHRRKKALVVKSNPESKMILNPSLFYQTNNFGFAQVESTKNLNQLSQPPQPVQQPKA